MHRNNTKKRQDERTSISNSVQKKTSETVETDDETFTKLLAGNAYDKEDIEKNVKPLLKNYKYSYERQFVLVENFSDFEQDFQNVTIEPDQPIFVILAKEEKKWILLCVVQKENHTVVLFKDPCGEPVSEQLGIKLTEKFPGCEFITQSGNDQDADDKKSYGPLTLRNLKILLEFLKKKTELTKFCELEFVKTTDLNKEKAAIVCSLTNELSENQEFITALKKFIAKLPLQLNRGLTDYRKVLEEELEKGEDKMDAAKIKQAREKCLRKEDLDQFQADYKWNLKEKTEESQLDITTKFPDEMKKLSKIFEVFDDLTVDKQLFAVLKKVSEILQIDYNNIEMLYKYKVKTEKLEETEKLMPQDIQEIAKNLKEPTSKVSDCTPFKELLKETILGMDQDDNSSTPGSESELEKIEEKYNIVKTKYGNWKNKNVYEINDWAKRIKGRLGTTDDDVCEAIAVMDRAFYLLNEGYNLRETQILAVLIYFHEDKNQGRLCQIQTGEGKTVIVSLLAVIRALQGHTVDVITSNPLLADDGVNETKTFYSIFGLTVSTNNPGEGNSHSKIGYEADVLYGTISNFQFDYLKDTFEGFNIRRERQFGQVVLDEVDSMLVDNGGHIAKLAAPYPGMECLRYIYIKIWQELYKAEESFAREGQEKIQEILSNYQGDEARLEYSKFIQDCIENERKIIKEKIKAADPTNIPLVPAHLKQYVESKLDTWLKNALYAKYNCHEHQQYRIIEDDSGERVIAPVDYLNTGVTMKNTIWSNGLHQFVQLKHNIYLTFESLTSSFISNIGYIKNYSDNNIFGLTGTLGSRAEQELLSSIYKVTYAKIPTYKKKKFEELPGRVVPDASWSTQLTLEILSMIDQERAVLVILETEKDLLTIKQNLELLQDKGFRIRTFANEENAKETRSKVKIGDIILATNIAGRGTNFRTEATLEEKGGLHVCVGFLPCNLRVEGQAFGRTSRQGNNGTAQLIIRQSEVEELELEEPNPGFVSIKTKRDIVERDRLKQINDVLVKELNFKDELFKLFSNYYRNLKSLHSNSESFSYVLQDFKEYWAFWLEKNDFKVPKINNTSPSQEFDGFLNEDICKNIIRGTISHNPFYGVMLADYFLDTDDRANARSSLEHALNIGGEENQELLAGAHLKLFEVAILSGEQLKERFKKAVAEIFFVKIQKNDTYRETASGHLEAAKKAIERELGHIEAHFADREDFARIITEEERNLFLKHIFSRQICLNVHLKNIEELINQLKKFNGVDLKGKIRTTLDNFLELVDKKEVVENLTNCEMTELHSIGVDALYALKEIHDVPNEVISGAKGQIIAGMGALCVGLAFFPLFPMMSSIAGTLISEGVIDIVMEILSQGETDFDNKDYMKGKFITYGISLLTFGIGAVTQSVKILSIASSFCRKLSTWLRKCEYLKKVCTHLANVVDKIGNKLDDMITIAKINKLSAAKKATEMQKLQKAGKIEMFEKLGGIEALNELNKIKDMSKFQQALKMTGTFAIQTGKSIGKTLVEELVVKPTVDKLIKNLTEAPINQFKDHLKTSIRNNQKVMKKLQTTPIEQINQTVENFLKTNEFVDISFAAGKEILGVVDNLAIDVITSAATVSKNITEFVRLSTCCTSYLEKHLQGGSSENDVDEVLEDVGSEIVEKMFALCYDSVSETKKYIKTGIEWGKKKIKDKMSGNSSDNHEKESPSKKHTINKTKLKIAAKNIAKKVGPVVVRKALEEAIKQLKEFFKTELKKEIRSNAEVVKKLRATLEKDIDKCVGTFMEGNKALAIARNVETRVFNALKSDVADLVVATSNIIIDSIDFASYFTKFTLFLQKNLPGGDCDNDLDNIIEEITTKLADQMFNLLLNIGKNGFTLSKTSYHFSRQDVKKMLSKQNLVGNVFNRKNLTNFAKDMIEEQVYQPFVDELTKKIVEQFKEGLYNDITGNRTVMKKIQTAPLDKIESCVERFLGGNEIVNFVESMGMKLLENSKNDFGKVLKGSYDIIKNSVDFDKCKRKFTSFLDANLTEEDSSNDANEITEEICSIVAEHMFDYLSAIVKGSKDLIDVGKKIKLKHLKSIRFDKKSVKQFGKDIAPVLKNEVINQTAKLLSELKNSDQVNQFLESKSDGFLGGIKPILGDIIPLLQEDEIKKFATELSSESIDPAMKAVTPILKKEAKRRIAQSVSELCTEENFYKVVGTEIGSVVKKVKPVVDAIAPDLEDKVKEHILTSVNALIDKEDLGINLKLKTTNVKDVLNKLTPLLQDELAKRMSQVVSKGDVQEMLTQRLKDVKPVVAIVAPLFNKEVSSKVSQLVSNDNLQNLLSSHLGATADNIKPVMETIVLLMNEEINTKAFDIFANLDWTKQIDLCKAGNIVKALTPFIASSVSQLLAEEEVEKLASQLDFDSKKVKAVIEAVVPVLTEEVFQWVKPDDFQTLASLDNVKSLVEVVAPILTNKMSSQISTLLTELSSDETMEETLNSELGVALDEVKQVLETVAASLNKEITKQMSISSLQVTYSFDIKKMISAQEENHRIKDVVEAVTHLLKEKVVGSVTSLSEDKHLQEQIIIKTVVDFLKKEIEKQLPSLVSQLTANENLQNVLEAQMTSSLGAIDAVLKNILPVLTKKMSTKLLELTSNKKFQQTVSSQLGTTLDAAQPIIGKIQCVLDEKITTSITDLFSNPQWKFSFGTQLQGCGKMEVLTSVLNEEIAQQVPKSISQLFGNQKVQKVLESQLGTTLDKVKPAMEKITPVLTQEVLKQIPDSVTTLLSMEDFEKILTVQSETTKTVTDILTDEISSKASSSLLHLLLDAEFQKKLPNIENKTELLSAITPILKKEFTQQMSKTVPQLISKQFNHSDNVVIQTVSPFLKEEILEQVEKIVDEFVDDDENTQKLFGTTGENIGPVLEELASTIADEVTTSILHSVCQQITSEDLEKVLVPQLQTDNTFSVEEEQSLLNDQMPPKMSLILSSKEDLLKALNVQHLVDFALLHLPEELTLRFMGVAKMLNNAKEAYEMLELPLDASLVEVKRRYREIVLQIHPKKNPEDDEAEETYKLVVKAYKDILSYFEK